MAYSEASDSDARLEIFLVEDNPCDVVLFKQILRKSSVAYSLTVVSDGVTAVERLREGARPNTIFLDLNLPGKTGKEILAELKQTPELASIPVAVLTGSADAQDEQICNLLGADRYFTKAVALADFFLLTTQIAGFLQTLEIHSASVPLSGYPAISAA